MKIINFNPVPWRHQITILVISVIFILVEKIMNYCFVSTITMFSTSKDISVMWVRTWELLFEKHIFFHFLSNDLDIPSFLISIFTLVICTHSLELSKHKQYLCIKCPVKDWKEFQQWPCMVRFELKYEFKWIGYLDVIKVNTISEGFRVMY